MEDDEMTITNWIGVAILAAVFVGLVAVTAWAIGSAREAVIMWAAALATSGVIIAGAKLATGG